MHVRKEYILWYTCTCRSHHYVLVPADKAGNNVIIVCKQYYKEVLTRELKNNSGTSTYLQCNEPVDKVIQSHLGFMEQHGIDVPKDFI